MPTRDATPVQSTTAAHTSKFGDFKQIAGSTNSRLYILEVEADYNRSIELLDQAGLRPLKYQEILLLLMSDEKLKNLLKEKSAYLAGKGLDKDGNHTINNKDGLADIKDKNLSSENKVYVFKGSDHLLLSVCSDNDTANYGWRFFLDAYIKSSQDTANLVMGVPKMLLEHRRFIRKGR